MNADVLVLMECKSCGDALVFKGEVTLTLDSPEAWAKTAVIAMSIFQNEGWVDDKVSVRGEPANLCPACYRTVRDFKTN